MKTAYHTYTMRVPNPNTGRLIDFYSVTAKDEAEAIDKIEEQVGAKANLQNALKRWRAAGQPVRKIDK